MRRIPSLLLFMILWASAANVTAANIVGDANNDDVQTMADAELVQNALYGTAAPSTVSPLAAAGGDLSLGLDDLMLVAQIANAVVANILPPDGLVLFAPPAPAIYASGTNNPITYDIASACPEAQMVNGLANLTYTIDEVVESTLSGGDAAVTNGSVGVILEALNTTGSDDSVTIRATMDLLNSSGGAGTQSVGLALNTVTSCNPIVCPATAGQEQLVGSDANWEANFVSTGWTFFNNAAMNDGNAYYNSTTTQPIGGDFTTQDASNTYYVWALGFRSPTNGSLDIRIDGASVGFWDDSTDIGNILQWQMVGTVNLTAGTHDFKAYGVTADTSFFDGWVVTTDATLDPPTQWTPLNAENLNDPALDYFIPGSPGTECCGNCVVDAGEACDAGTGSVPYGGCDDTCQLNVCGDGAVDPTYETCDDSNTADCDGCSGDCQRVDDVCGDGTAECGEFCDDGDSGACAGPCNETCTALYVATCGNGATECGEACDDGDTDNCTVACNDTCTGPVPAEVCGDGIQTCNETCDDGDTDDCTAACNATCTGPGITPVCGDGNAECAETCDDGDTDDCTAACNATCTGPGITPVCGDGNAECAEACDDGFLTDCGPCNSTCTALGSGGTCGDNVVCEDLGETCDDGNTTPGDGCDDLCQSECTPIACPAIAGQEQLVGADATWEANFVSTGWTFFNNAAMNAGSAYYNSATTQPIGGDFTTQDASNTYYVWVLGFRSPTNGSMDIRIDGSSVGVWDDTTDIGNILQWQMAGTANLSAGPHDLKAYGVTTDTSFFDGWVVTTDAAFDPQTQLLPLNTYNLDDNALDYFIPGSPGTECCGNCVVDAGETCDPGDSPVAYGGCTDACQLNVCGDGAVDIAYETCDDSNTANCDGCSGDCQRLDDACGDGISECGEFCDDGDSSACAGPCNETCTALYVATCGNGATECGESCDDGDTDDCTAACNATCTGPGITPVCGDGAAECGEACDDGYLTDCGPCNSTCTALGSGGTCGDSIVCEDLGETCDDGNTTPGDGCDDLCHSECTPIACPATAGQEQMAGSDAQWDANFVSTGWTFFNNAAMNGGSAYYNNANNLPIGGDFTTQDASNTYYIWVLGFRTAGDGSMDIHINDVSVGVWDDSTNIGSVLDWQMVGTANLSAATHTFKAYRSPTAISYFDGWAVTTDAALDPQTAWTPLTSYNVDDPALDYFIPGSPGTECCGDCNLDIGEECEPGDSPVAYGGCDDQCVLRVCGDGDLDSPDETCDDGDLDDCTPACNATCSGPGITPVCGDGVMECGETCDDVVGACAGVCNATCDGPATGLCGDGAVNCSEECDDGNTTPGDGCDDFCMTECTPILPENCPPASGDEQMAGEDDTWDSGFTNAGWTFFSNPAMNGGSAYYTNSTVAPFGGDFATLEPDNTYYVWVLGFRTASDGSMDIEIDGASVGVWDDSTSIGSVLEWQMVGTANLMAGAHDLKVYGVTSAISYFDGWALTTDNTLDPTNDWTPFNSFNLNDAALDYHVPGSGEGTCCGDCVVEGSELCDPGNNPEPYGGCSAQCTLRVCNDGVLDGTCDDNGEPCDGGIDLLWDTGDEVLTNCADPGTATCLPIETCEDGNLVDCDGCSANCILETGCGDGAVCAPEVCDDGNTLGCLGDCNADCTAPILYTCGDGNRECGEECDDGNLAFGDGCDADCQIECVSVGCTGGPDEQQLVGREDSFDSVTPGGWPTIPNAAYNGGNVRYAVDNLSVFIGDFTTDVPLKTFYVWHLGYRTTSFTSNRSQEIKIDGNLVGIWNDSTPHTTNSLHWQMVGTIDLDTGPHTYEVRRTGSATAHFDGYAITTDPLLDPPTQFFPYVSYNLDDPGLDWTSGVGGGGGACCGDCTVDEGEECDWGGAYVPGDGCTFDCKYISCGDGVATNPEACDDGNRDACDGYPGGCSADCSLVEECGNGVVECGEECDNGTHCEDLLTSCKEDADCSGIGDALCLPRAGDGCDDLCRLEICGDGVINSGTEQCDLGNYVDEDDPSVGPAGQNGDGIHGVCLDVNGDSTGAACLWDPFTLDPACPVDGECARCSSECNYVRCGNGYLEPENEEQCDPPNDVTCLNEDPVSLDSFCQLATLTCNGGSETGLDCTDTPDLCIAGGGTCDREIDGALELVACVYPDPNVCTPGCAGSCLGENICLGGLSAGADCGRDFATCEGGGGYCDLDGLCTGGTQDGTSCDAPKEQCETDGGYCLLTPICDSDGLPCNECARPVAPVFECTGAITFPGVNDGEAVCGNGVIQGVLDDSARNQGYTGYCSDDPVFGGAPCTTANLDNCLTTECADAGGASVLACSADIDSDGHLATWGCFGGNTIPDGEDCTFDPGPCLSDLGSCDLIDTCGNPCTDTGGICMNVCSVDADGDGLINDPFDCIETDDGNPRSGWNEQCDDGGNCTFDAERAGESCISDAECNPFGVRTGECQPSSGDGCNTFCLAERCGNYFLDAGEQCDPPNGSTCDGDCQYIPPTNCGNGVVEDAGFCNYDNTIACSSADIGNCPSDPTGCGIASCVGAEDCDDGNVVAGDGCSPLCTDEALPRCGNFVLEIGETCDPPLAKFCNASCDIFAPGKCGSNGAEAGGGGCNTGETCDDGNGLNGDGCSEWCQYEGCSNGTVESIPVPQWRCYGESTGSCGAGGGTCDETFTCQGGTDAGNSCPGPDGDDASCADGLLCNAGPLAGTTCTINNDCNGRMCITGANVGTTCLILGPGTDAACAGGTCADVVGNTCTTPDVGLCVSQGLNCNGGSEDGSACSDAESRCVQAGGACDSASRTCEGGLQDGTDCSEDPLPCEGDGGQCVGSGSICVGGDEDGRVCETTGWATDSGRYCLPPENAHLCAGDGGTCDPVERCLGGPENGNDCNGDEAACLADSGTCQETAVCTGTDSGALDGTDCLADPGPCEADNGFCDNQGTLCTGTLSGDLDGTPCAGTRDACEGSGGVCSWVLACGGTTSGDMDGAVCVGGDRLCVGGATIPDLTPCTVDIDETACLADGGVCVGEADRNCLNTGGTCDMNTGECWGGATITNGTACEGDPAACEADGGRCIGTEFLCNGGTGILNYDDGSDTGLCADFLRCCANDGSQFCAGGEPPAECRLAPSIEECDDGNRIDGDGCSSSCQLECGNGVLDGLEECDGGEGCSPGCKLLLCGNGAIDESANEECDDGNRLDGDGCSQTCTIE